LIGENGEQLGVLSFFDALNQARAKNLDLVEVAPTAVPPVCRLMDYGRFKYEQTKKERDAHKHQKNVELKEVRLRPKIGVHDVDFKINQAHKFLEEGDKVKLTVLFRGREVTHPQLGRDLLDRAAANLKDVATVEKPTSFEGRNMSLILAPVPAKAVKEPQKSGSEKE
jgi:translation initiation factor IF-3